MATLSFKGLNKIYPNKVQAVFDFNLEIKDKEFIVFVGPSGCGKSTTLRMVAGLEDITSGELYIDGTLVNNIAPKDRNIAMVFQSYALYPHMTVFDNMAFALKLRKVPRPLYEENEDVAPLKAELDNLYKEVASMNKKLKKKVEDDLLMENIELYHQLFELQDQIESELTQKIGIDEHGIKQIEKQIEKIYKDTAKAEKLYAKYCSELQELIDKGIENEEVEDYQAAIKLLESNLDRNGKQVEILTEQLNYLQNNEVPLFEERHLTKREIDFEVHKAAESLDLLKYLYRKPAALSGGQRQRVALGRAIVRKPKVFLMDEPLSNLDAKLRVQTRSEIIKIHQRVGATTIYVTHDQTEAMTMADRIVIMKDGYIQQIGTPTDLYDDPANMFVGGFIGSPAMNFLTGTVKKDKFVVDGEKELEIKLEKEHVELLKEYNNKQVCLGIRPEACYLKGDRNNEKPGNDINCVCDFEELLGYELIVYTYLNGQRFILKTSINSQLKTGDELAFNFNMKKVYFFDAETKMRIK